MEQLEYIAMEPDFREAIRERYSKPFKRNMRALITALLLVYAMIIAGVLYFTESAGVNVTMPVIVATAGLLLLFWMSYPKFKKMHIHYKQDAEFGKIVKERTAVVKVFDTPAGIDIYWLASDAIKTFTPDPYRIFHTGDVVTIYYLKYSKEYLAYEI